MANYANDSTDRLRENANEGGVQNPENFANVINGCPLMRNARSRAKSNSEHERQVNFYCY